MKQKKKEKVHQQILEDLLLHHIHRIEELVLVLLLLLLLLLLLPLGKSKIFFLMRNKKADISRLFYCAYLRNFSPG